MPLFPPTVISTQEYGVLGILAGLTLEISVSGIVSTVVKLITNPRNFWTLAIIMTLFNIWSVVYNVLFVWTFFLGPTNCGTGQRAVAVSAHAFYLIFDLFLLCKTYAISENNRVILIIACLIFTNRAVWAVWDIVQSTGIWDSEEVICDYFQFSSTAIGANTADVISNVFCTVAGVIVNWGLFGKGAKENINVLVQENILRSATVLIVNAIQINATFTCTDSYFAALAFLLQNYVYARCLNAELFWIEAKIRTGNTDFMASGRSGGSQLSRKNTVQKPNAAEIIKTVVSVRESSPDGVGGVALGKEKSIKKTAVA
ncbi:hypothetical protein HDU98_005896 [Podochytrium sp. JEL0797]|nr:hypothetical protein HDU98_005896 [Podochytrium sp. JEL0797]